jgi:hypothetical protein
MAKDRVLVKIQAEMGDEDAYFREQDEKIIKERRENATREANAKYRDEHKNHCFRCGTESLVEVDRGDVKVDLCVNEDCGAVHLDPGELELILKDKKAISSIRKSVFAVFKK